MGPTSFVYWGINGLISVLAQIMKPDPFGSGRVDKVGFLGWKVLTRFERVVHLQLSEHPVLIESKRSEQGYCVYSSPVS